jgi:hypothetical protein
MAVTTLAQGFVLGFADRVALGGDTRPMVDGVAEPWMASVSPNDHTALAGSLGDRRNPAQSPQSRVVSSLQGFPAFSEQRGERDPSDTWQGVEDHGVALLGLLPRRGLRAGFRHGGSERRCQPVKLAVRMPQLAFDQAQAFDQRADVRHGRLAGAGRDPDRLGAQELKNAGGIDAPDAVVLQYPRDRRLAHAGRLGGRRHGLPKIVQPGGPGIRFDAEHLRIVAPQLLPHAIGKTGFLGRQVLRHARPLTQLDHYRIGQRELAEGVRVSAQRRRHRLGVTAVVLGASHRETVTEAVELLGIDRVDVKAALQQRLDDGTMRHLDADRDLSGLGPASGGQPLAKQVKSLAAMGKDFVAEAAAICVRHPDIVLLGRPVDAGKKVRRLAHSGLRAAIRWRYNEPARRRSIPVLALRRLKGTGAVSPLDLNRGHPPGHRSPPGARRKNRHRGQKVAPDGMARTLSIR